jgi:hypothetical protein
MPHCSAPGPSRCATASLSANRGCPCLSLHACYSHRCCRSRLTHPTYEAYAHDWQPTRLDRALCLPKCECASSLTLRPCVLAPCRTSDTAVQGYYYKEQLLWVRATPLPSCSPRRSRDSRAGGSVLTTIRSASGIGGQVAHAKLRSGMEGRNWQSNSCIIPGGTAHIHFSVSNCESSTSLKITSVLAHLDKLPMTRT